MTAARLLWNFRTKDEWRVGLDEFVKKRFFHSRSVLSEPRGNIFYDARIFTQLCNLKSSTNRARPSGSRGAIFNLHA